MTRRQWAQLAGVVLLVAALVIVSVSVGVPGVSRLREDFAQFGVWAGVVYAGLYAAVSLAPLPAAVFTLGAGALFGVTEGLVVVEAGATVGAVIGFWLARVLGRDFVARVSGASVEKLDERFTGRGVLAVLAVRLLPVLPFAAVNYVSGLTSIRFRHYLLGTVVGILPAATAYVVLGAYGSRPGSVPFLVALGGLLVLVVVGLVSGQRNRRARKAVQQPHDPLRGRSRWRFSAAIPLPADALHRPLRRHRHHVVEPGPPAVAPESEPTSRAALRPGGPTPAAFRRPRRTGAQLILHHAVTGSGRSKRVALPSRGSGPVRTHRAVDRRLDDRDPRLPHPPASVGVTDRSRPCHRPVSRVNHADAWRARRPCRAASSARVGRSAATCSPVGLVNTCCPTRTVGTVSSPRLAWRTNERAASSAQMLCHWASIPQRVRARRSRRQYGPPVHLHHDHRRLAHVPVTRYRPPLPPGWKDQAPPAGSLTRTSTILSYPLTVM